MMRKIFQSALVLFSLCLLPALSAQVQIGSGVQVGGSPATATNPYDVTGQISPGEVNLTQLVEQETAGGTTVTAADITGHSGTVSSFFFASCLGTNTCASSAGSANDTIINIYIDGSATPSVTFDVGVIGSHWNNLSSGGFSFADAGASVGWSNAGKSQVILFKYPMYYSTEWKATITVPSEDTAGLYWFFGARYTTAYTSALRLKSTNVTSASSVSTNLATTPFVFLNLASGSGTIAAIFISTAAATNYTYLEAGFYAYYDGSGTAQYQTTGGEDVTGSSWYFEGQKTYQSAWSYMSNSAGTTGGGAYGLDFNTDFLAMQGGIPFTNGVKFDWEKIPAKATAITTSVNIAYLCLYYQ